MQQRSLSFHTSTVYGMHEAGAPLQRPDIIANYETCLFKTPASFGDSRVMWQILILASSVVTSRILARSGKALVFSDANLLKCRQLLT